MLQTFHIPDRVTGNQPDLALARRMVGAWRTDGIFQVQMDAALARITLGAFEQSRRFFKLPHARKARCASDLSYSGYVASGEEVTAGEADGSEVFTVCKDLPPDDPRVRKRWPCHGPVPWPDAAYRDAMAAFMEAAGALGEAVLKLAALGLGMPMNALTNLTADGWHHMRVLRFPPASPQSARGIGAHTDYGLLVIAAQEDVGGLYVRPPVAGEARRRNWIFGESTAGMYEHDEPWTCVAPVPRVLTVFPGDILQFITAGHLLSTPHKVRLAGRERHAIAYFHEPGFEACVRPLMGSSPYREFIHYGTHFTNMFARCYPERAATRRLDEEDRWSTLAALREAALGAPRFTAALPA